VCGWYSFPSAERANEGVSVLVPEQVGGFIQLEDRVAEIMASQLVAGFIENALVTAACLPQFSLQST
jgi:hypothetical protein